MAAGDPICSSCRQYQCICGSVLAGPRCYGWDEINPPKVLSPKAVAAMLERLLLEHNTYHARKALRHAQRELRKL